MFYLKFLSSRKFRLWYTWVVGLVLLVAVYGLVALLLGWLPGLLLIIFACVVSLWIKFIIDDLAEKERQRRS